MPTLSADKPDKNALQMVIHNPNDNAAKVVYMWAGARMERRGRRGLQGPDKANNSKIICIRAYRVFSHASSLSPSPCEHFELGCVS